MEQVSFYYRRYARPYFLIDIFYFFEVNDNPTWYIDNTQMPAWPGGGDKGVG